MGEATVVCGIEFEKFYESWVNKELHITLHESVGRWSCVLRLRPLILTINDKDSSEDALLGVIDKAYKWQRSLREWLISATEAMSPSYKLTDLQLPKVPDTKEGT